MATPTVDFLPDKVNAKFERGDTVGYGIQFDDADGQPIDLTGRTFAAQLRRSPNATVAVDVTVDTTDAATGRLVFRLEPDVTEGLSGDYLWDLQQTMGGTVRTLLAGKWTFALDVTRDE